MSLVVTIAVGDRPGALSLAQAGAVAALAEELGVAALRLSDRGLDPSVVAAHLAGRHGGVGYVAEIPTTHHAPYNVARRVLSLDRATGGRIGVALLPGDGDEVTEQSIPAPTVAGAARRWAEYARVLTRLWESFPRQALIGDQVAGLVVDDTRIRPIDHEGEFYRVAGPLDGPSSVQGRPVIVADLTAGTADIPGLDVAAVAESADVVVTDRPAGVDMALASALSALGRSRDDVTLLGRIALTPTTDPSVLRIWVNDQGLDGLELVVSGDVNPGDLATVLRAVVPLLVTPGSAPTLRAAFGLREIEEVPA